MNFKGSRHKIFVLLAMSTNRQNKKFQSFQKSEKIIPGQLLGQYRPDKNSAKRLNRSGEVPSPPHISIDKTDDCVTSSERGEFVKGSDTATDHSVQDTAGDAWRAPARRLAKKNFHPRVRKTRRLESSIPPRWQKLFRFGRRA